MRRPAWAELVRSGLAQTRAGSHGFEWVLNWASAGLGSLNWISMGSSGVNWVSTGLASLGRTSRGTLVLLLRVLLFSLLLVCSALVACSLLLSLLATCRLPCATCRVRACCMSFVALRLCLVLRAACCLRTHSTSLPHCTFPVAFFFVSSTKSCPDFDFSGRELRL